MGIMVSSSIISAMNFGRRAFLGVLLLLLLAGAAQAAITIEPDPVTLSVDYKDFRTEEQLNITQTRSLTLQSTEVSNVSVSLAVEFSPVGSTTAGGYAADFSSTAVVPANSSLAVPITFQIPHLARSGQTNIGTLILRDAAGAELDRVPLVQDTKSMLIIEELVIDYVDEDGNNERQKFDEKDAEFNVREGAKPGTPVSITIRVENLFDNDYDEDKSVMEDIELSFEFDDDDISAESIEEDYEFGDLEAGEAASLTIEFEIDEEAEDKEYEATLSLSGIDGENVRHDFERVLLLEVKRERDDVRVRQAVLKPAVIDACLESFSLDVELQNYGTRRQKYAGLAAFSQPLGINLNIADIELDEYDESDNTWREQFSFPLEDVGPGTYQVDLRVFVDRDEQISDEQLEVAIARCPVPAEEEEENESLDASAGEEGTSTAEDNLIMGAGSGGTGASGAAGSASGSAARLSGAAAVETVEAPRSLEKLFLFALAAAIVVIVALIVVLAVMLLKK